MPTPYPRSGPAGDGGDRGAGTHRHASRRNRRRRTLAAVACTLAGGLAVAVLAVPGVVGELAGEQVALPADAAPAGQPPVTESPTPTTAPVLASPTPNAPVLRLPGPVPSAGSGTFAYSTGHGEVLGRAGTLRRYRVAVEDGAGEDADEFAAAVDLVLADPGSWTAGGRLRLQRVSDRAGHDFTIHLATARTAGRICAAGGVDIRVDGRPYTSCRVGSRVVINLDRWRRSVDHFVAARVPLVTYRAYVINHEVGHALGHSHERCPGRGRPAPIMMKQTLYLDGCVANPWPYLDGRRYLGPPL